MFSCFALRDKSEGLIEIRLVHLKKILTMIFQEIFFVSFILNNNDAQV